MPTRIYHSNAARLGYGRRPGSTVSNNMSNKESDQWC